MRSLGMKLLAVAAVVVIATPVFAQTDTYGAKADVVFELQPSKLTGSPLGKKLDLKSKLEAVTGQDGGFDFSKVDRVLTGMVAPADVENLEKIQQGAQNEMEFFVRMEFSDPAEVSKLIAEAAEDKANVIEKNGKKYYRPPAGSQELPESTVMYQISDKVIELASEGFAYRTVEMPLTDALAAAWKTMPDEALKISIDGVSARGLIKSMVKDGKKQAAGNPIAGAVLDLFPTMDNINLSVDLESANLLTMKMVGTDEDASGDIHDAFKSVMTIVKPEAMKGLGVLEAQAPEPAAVFGKVISGMDVKQDGKNVTLHIPRPDGFEDATVQVVPIIQALVLQRLLGGGGPGGPGGPPSDGF